MNNERRKEIRKICGQIENLVGKLDDILFEAAKDSLSEAVESLEEVL